MVVESRNPFRRISTFVDCVIKGRDPNTPKTLVHDLIKAFFAGSKREELVELTIRP
jgi:hypothetical protein